MIMKVLNLIINVLAVLGVVICVGAVGTMDYMVTIHEPYSMWYTVGTLFVGVFATVPAILRRYYSE